MRAWQLSMVWLAHTGCALVTPLDSIAASVPSDAGHTQRPMSRLDGRAPEPSDEETCTLAPRADCNPSQPCGCTAPLRCGLDEPTGRVRCLPPSSGTLDEGAACSVTADCAPGLECTGSKICSPYCESDADCNGHGKCLAFLNPRANSEVPGSGACSRWCDPFSGKPCLEQTTCVGTGETTRDPTASCRAFQLGGVTEGRALGESCDNIYQCAQGLGCAEYGLKICTPFCNEDTACPESLPHCHVTDIISAPGKPIGQCMVWPCDDTTLPAPKPWSQGPVWTAAQLAACKMRCGATPDCHRSTCDDGARWGECIDAVLAECGGVPGGSCRQEYVRSTCCDVLDCVPHEQRFVECLQRQPECVKRAEQVCAR